MSPAQRPAQTRVVQLHVVSPVPVLQCDELLVGWAFEDGSVSIDAYLEVVLLHSGSPAAQSASNSTPVQLLGQARLSDQQFLWSRANVAPGTYIIDATANGSKILTFSHTSPFVISDTTPDSDSSICSSSESQFSSSSSRENVLLATPDSNPTMPSAGLIAGVAIAALVVVAAVIVVVWYYLRRRRRAPVALRPRTPVILPSGTAQLQMISPAPTPIPVLSIPPLSPVIPSERRSPTVHDIPQSPFDALKPGRQSTAYAESIAVSDDSFAEERDMLREEFLDAATSVGGGRGGRPFTSRESSVWSDLPVGPDGMALQLEAGKKKATKSLTFAISNPDNTVWEEDEQYKPRAGPS